MARILVAVSLENVLHMRAEFQVRWGRVIRSLIRCSPIATREIHGFVIIGTPNSHLSFWICVWVPSPILIAKPSRQSWIDLHNPLNPHETLPNLAPCRAMLIGEFLYLLRRICDIKACLELWILITCLASSALLNRWTLRIPSPPPPFGSSSKKLV